jgi:hypothetical protein
MARVMTSGKVKTSEIGYNGLSAAKSQTIIIIIIMNERRRDAVHRLNVGRRCLLANLSGNMA